MRSLPRGVWHYATLLLFVLSIASFAAWTTMDYLYDNIRAEEYQNFLHMANFKVWALTLGLMFMAGASGLWAIQFSAESESQLRITQVVESMDYLNDGLMAVDKRGWISGCNPALKGMVAAENLRDVPIKDIFPCLSDEDLKLLLDMHGPNEVQRDLIQEEQKRVLRFRSQTAGTTALILVSDVTTVRLDELHKQQIARLELVGRVARGVANDFNEILSGISGHASLISRLDPGSDDIKTSLTSIIKDSERGAHLAGHLLEFSHLSVMGRPTDNLGEHVRKASDLIRIGLPSAWKVEVTVTEDLPPVPLSGLQVEQVILNLGLVAADMMRHAGVVRVTGQKPGSEQLTDVGEGYGAVVIISAANYGEKTDSELSDGAGVEDTGVMQSVARSLLEEAGGKLDSFSGQDGSHIFRIVLPYGSIEAENDDDEGLPGELEAYISDWNVLLARSTKTHDHVEEKLEAVGVGVERVDNIMSALARVEDGRGMDTIVIEKDLLGDEAVGLLRAIVKLCPTTGVVVLCEDPDLESKSLSQNVVFTSQRADPVRIIKAMVEAKALVAHR